MTREILVVDETEDIQELVEEVLGAHGYNVQTVGDVDEAITVAGEEDLDLILMDIVMPDNGYDACREFKKRKNTSAPVVMFSILDDPRYKEKAEAVGADGYIVKPFKPEELVEGIENYLS